MNIQYLLFTLLLRCATNNDDDGGHHGGIADTNDDDGRHHSGMVDTTMAIFSGCEVTRAGKTTSREERVFNERGEKSKVWGL